MCNATGLSRVVCHFYATFARTEFIYNSQIPGFVDVSSKRLRAILSSYRLNHRCIFARWYFEKKKFEIREDKIYKNFSIAPVIRDCRLVGHGWISKVTLFTFFRRFIYLLRKLWYSSVDKWNSKEGAIPLKIPSRVTIYSEGGWKSRPLPSVKDNKKEEQRGNSLLNRVTSMTKTSVIQIFENKWAKKTQDPTPIHIVTIFTRAWT